MDLGFAFKIMRARAPVPCPPALSTVPSEPAAPMSNASVWLTSAPGSGKQALGQQQSISLQRQRDTRSSSPLEAMPPQPQPEPHQAEPPADVLPPQPQCSRVRRSFSAAALTSAQGLAPESSTGPLDPGARSPSPITGAALEAPPWSGGSLHIVPRPLVPSARGVTIGPFAEALEVASNRPTRRRADAALRNLPGGAHASALGSISSPGSPTTRPPQSRNAQPPPGAPPSAAANGPKRARRNAAQQPPLMLPRVPSQKGRQIMLGNPPPSGHAAAAAANGARLLGISTTAQLTGADRELAAGQLAAAAAAAGLGGVGTYAQAAAPGAVSASGGPYPPGALHGELQGGLSSHASAAASEDYPAPPAAAAPRGRPGSADGRRIRLLVGPLGAGDGGAGPESARAGGGGGGGGLHRVPSLSSSGVEARSRAVGGGPAAAAAAGGLQGWHGDPSQLLVNDAGGHTRGDAAAIAAATAAAAATASTASNSSTNRESPRLLPSLGPLGQLQGHPPTQAQPRSPGHRRVAQLQTPPQHRQLLPSGSDRLLVSETSLEQHSFYGTLGEGDGGEGDGEGDPAADLEELRTLEQWAANPQLTPAVVEAAMEQRKALRRLSQLRKRLLNGRGGSSVCTSPEPGGGGSQSVPTWAHDLVLTGRQGSESLAAMASQVSRLPHIDYDQMRDPQYRMLLKARGNKVKGVHPVINEEQEELPIRGRRRPWKPLHT